MGDIPKFEQLTTMQHPIPLLTRERFAELIGLPVSVLVAQTEKGYWPTLKIGKRVFINVALVHQQCLERAFK